MRAWHRPPLLRLSPARGRMRGAMAVLGVFWLSIAVICLMVIDIGHVFWQQREVQKIADMAAMAAASGEEAECPTYALQSAQRNGLAGESELQAVQCGNWNPLSAPTTVEASVDRPPQFFVANRAPFNAARVTVQRTVPYFFVFAWGDEGARTVMATATAARSSPLAALNIRSTTLTLNTERSALLNAVVGGLLGGSINLTAVGWNGLANTQVDLLSYLDALAIELGVKAGDYDRLLRTDVDVATLLNVAADVLERGGSTAELGAQAVAALVDIAAAVPAATPLLQLADFLKVQTGAPLSGLDMGLDLMHLVQGAVQVANGKSAVAAEIPANLLGLANARVSLKVIEPPQISAIGDPALAKRDPYGQDAIFVRTAQIRTLVSVDLPALSGLSALTNAVSTALSGVTTVLNRLLSLDLSVLGDVLACTLGCTRETTDYQLLPPPLRLDLSLDVGGGQSRVVDYQCNASKELEAQTRTAVADIRVGQMGATAEAAKLAVFSSAEPPTPAMIPVLDIGSVRCTRILLGLIPVSCDESSRKPFYGGGLGISTHIPVAAHEQMQRFVNPPRLDEAPRYEAIHSTDIVNSLGGTVNGLNLLKPIPPTSVAEGPGLGGLLSALTTALSSVTSVLSTVIKGVLSPLLDPLVNTLLSSLGIDVAQTEVAGRLSCAANVELVY